MKSLKPQKTNPYVKITQSKHNAKLTETSFRYQPTKAKETETEEANETREDVIPRLTNRHTSTPTRATEASRH